MIREIYGRILGLLMGVISTVSFVGPSVAYAAEGTQGEYTSALTDLSKDASFDEEKYPKITNPTHEKYGSIEVIQIAVSEDDELFIYTYQPSQAVLSLEATSINMWVGYNDKGFEDNVLKDFDVRSYALTLVSEDSVFCKYLVEDFTVESAGYQYYNVVEISRPFESFLDKELVGGVVNEVGIEVGKQWCLYTYNGVPVCEMNTFMVEPITVNYNDFIDLEGGLTWDEVFKWAMFWVNGYDYHRVHYLAFNFESHKAMYIYDADLSYTMVDYKYPNRSGVSGGPDGDYEDVTVTLKSTDKKTYVGDGLGGKTFSWNSIMPAATFKKDMSKQGVKFTEEAATQLDKSEWVFVFADYEKMEYRDPFQSLLYYETKALYDVDVLKIHFMDFSGAVYNLGVVGNKTTADSIPGGNGDNDLTKSFKDLIDAIGYLILAVLVIGICSLLIKFGGAIIKVLGWLGKGIVWLFTWPFKLKKKRNNTQEYDSRDRDEHSDNDYSGGKF